MMDIAKSRDPVKAMEIISPHLRDKGGIRKSSIKYLVELMKAVSNKLIPKCLVVNIIKASDETVQFRLFRQGAWDILFQWLTDAQKDENRSFILELLTFYLSVPVTMELLTLNRCPKVIKQLSKSSETDVNDTAAKIVKKWRRTVELQNSQSVDNTNVKKRKLENDPEDDIPKDVEQIKKRPLTVKMPPTHMRTAGLEEESTHSVKSRSEILSKKGLAEIKSPSHDKTTKEMQSSERSPDVNLESMHQKIKVQTEKRRSSHEMHESSGFIDALKSCSQPALRKKKKSNTKSDAPPSKLLKKDDGSIQNSQSSVNVKSDDNASNSSKDESNTSRNDETGPKKSSLTDLSSTVDINKKQKKRVSWATPDDLISIQYFELDATERIDVNRVSVEEMAKKEHLAESQLFTHGKRMSDDLSDSNGLLKWKTPSALEGIPTLEHYGMNSKEKKVQTERESLVLQAIYFSKESIPPSPAEPDAESYEHLEPKVIPLEDIIQPVPENPVETNPSTPKESKSLHEELLIFQQEGDAQMSLNPQIADLVKSLAENYSSSDNSKSGSSSNGIHSVVSTAQSVIEGHSIESVINSSSKGKFFTTEEQTGSLSGDDKMRAELMQLIQLNYPEINISELTVERVRELLEPLKEQLISRNIFPLPPNHYSSLPPPRYQGFGVPYKSGPPNGNLWAGPHIRGPVRGQMPPLGGPRGLPRQPICQYFMQGSCNKGAACAFMHPSVPPPNHGHRPPPRQMMHRPPYVPGNSGRGRMPRPPSQGFRPHHNYT